MSLLLLMNTNVVCIPFEHPMTTCTWVAMINFVGSLVGEIFVLDYQ